MKKSIIFAAIGIVVSVSVLVFVVSVYAQTCSAYLTKDVDNSTGFVMVIPHNQTMPLIRNTSEELEFVLTPNSVGHVSVLYHYVADSKLLCTHTSNVDNLQNIFHRNNMTLLVSDWKYNYWVPIQKDDRFIVQTIASDVQNYSAHMEYVITASQYAKTGWSYALSTPGSGPTIIVTIGNSPHQGTFPTFVTRHEAGPYGNMTVNETDIVDHDLSN